MPTQLIIQNPSLIKHGHKRPPHTQPSTLKTCKHSDMQEERHYLPSSAWSRNRMSSPAHAHTNTHFYTLANCERVSEEGWAREWERERENAIRREGRSRKDAEDREWRGNATARETMRRRRVRRRAYSCTYGDVCCPKLYMHDWGLCVQTAALSVCVCLCVRECVFPMSLSVEGKWQMWLSPLHDHLSFLHLSTLFCLLLSHSHWFEMSEPGVSYRTQLLGWTDE